MLKLTNLNQFYGQSHTLWDISLEVQKGECLCVMGRNGVGKTTLMDTIMGQHRIESGTIEFDGEDITKLSVEDRASLGIGYVPQGRQIFPLLTVEENLKIGIGARRDGLKAVPKAIYDMFPVLYDMRHRQGGDLSGGQQQRVALARALVVEPSVLLFDEPLSNLDAKLRISMRTEIRKIQQKVGITAIYVTHDQAEAMSLSDKIIIMNGGG